MPQVLKDEVQRRIAEAALRVFARRGFAGATMAEIGTEAGVSTGNLYRYHANKESLFRAVVPDAMVAELHRLLRRRLRAVEGVDDVRKLAAEAEFHAVSRLLMAFSVENRLAMAILLGHAEGTDHAGFAAALVDELTRSAIAHFRKLRPGLEVGRVRRAGVTRVYGNLLRAFVAALEEHPDPTEMVQAIRDYERYHLAGLKALFE